MSKKQSDYTLSDLISLKMTWFYTKNQANPILNDALEYLKTMVRGNVFKGHFKLGDVFPDYKLPDSIDLINKFYFEYLQNAPVRSGFGITRLDDATINELAVVSTDYFERQVDYFRSCIADNAQDMGNMQAKISQLYADISHLVRTNEGYNLQVSTYEAKIADGAKVDGDLLEQLSSPHSEFEIVAAVNRSIYFVSKSPIICAYYGSNVRKECEFGHAIVEFVKTDTCELILGKVYLSHIILPVNTAWHPHVNHEGKLCSGDASHVITNVDLPLDKRLNAIYSVLTTYNPANPYKPIEDYMNKFRDTGKYLHPTLPSVIESIFISESDLAKRFASAWLYHSYNGNRMSYTGNVRERGGQYADLREYAELWDNYRHSYLIEQVNSNNTDIPLEAVLEGIKAIGCANHGKDGYGDARGSNAFMVMREIAKVLKAMDIKTYSYHSVMKGARSQHFMPMEEVYYCDYTRDGVFYSLAECNDDLSMDTWVKNRPNHLNYVPFAVYLDEETLTEVSIRVQTALHGYILSKQSTVELTEEIPF
jgi:hypothetical protein